MSSQELVSAKVENGWRYEIVIGENCPNHCTAAALMESGIDRFQAEPRCMLVLVDAVVTDCIARIENCPIKTHIGGSFSMSNRRACGCRI